ncbi:hypothetical protein KSS87_011960 [Heliosperma pusillum]|nr:hypothetical protein KSS87_011960 [Heliosperma pusillum]
MGEAAVAVAVTVGGREVVGVMLRPSVGGIKIMGCLMSPAFTKFKSRTPTTLRIKAQHPSTYTSSISTDIPLYETPLASFDHYLEDKPRVFRAMFPDKQRSHRLNEARLDSDDSLPASAIMWSWKTLKPVIRHGMLDNLGSVFLGVSGRSEQSYELKLESETSGRQIFGQTLEVEFRDSCVSWVKGQNLCFEEWRVHMLPIEFLFMTVFPVIDMRLRCKTSGKEYPAGISPAISKVLELDIVRWELQGLDDAAKPTQFNLGVKGALYPDRRGLRTRLKGQLEMKISVILPPMLALVPEYMLRSVSETVLRKLVENMKDKVNSSLLADYSEFRKERQMGTVKN